RVDDVELLAPQQAIQRDERLEVRERTEPPGHRNLEERDVRVGECGDVWPARRDPRDLEPGLAKPRELVQQKLRQRLVGRCDVRDAERHQVDLLIACAKYPTCRITRRTCVVIRAATAPATPHRGMNTANIASVIAGLAMFLM